MINWNNSKYILLTLALVSFLIIPYILKLKNQRLEVFPSIIMPAGAGLIHKKDSITFGTYELYAKRNDSVKRLNIKKFLKPIPEWYIGHIAQSNFGLEPYYKEFKLYKPPMKFKIFNRFKPSELSCTQLFYKEKLQKLGYDDSILIYRNYKIQVRDSVKSKILVNEKIYNLK